VSARICDECGVPVRPGDGGVRVRGTVFCSERCADEREGLVLSDADPSEGYYGGYGEDPLGGA
jgi:hypothetical protein